MKSLPRLIEEFKVMPLAKQSIISIATITVLVAVLSNYKNIKEGSKEIVSKVTKDENIQEFMNDVCKVIDKTKTILQGKEKEEE